ncbi:MAG: acetylxylan esterase, partial [Saprospiraceae bacterium]|nr:acetylxylan esterase [Saprospiraceae bacterium]
MPYVFIRFCIFLMLSASPIWLLSQIEIQSRYQPKQADRRLIKDEEELDVLKNWIIWDNPGNSLISHMVDKAEPYYDRRDSIIKSLKSKEHWELRQRWVKDRLTSILGPFPHKTSLNPQITGTIDQEGYRIEKIIFESQPQYYVSACLYIPDHIQEKVPAVLNLIGHEQESFRAELDQLVMVNLVKKGIIVMSIDPPGQGENVQYYDPDLKLSRIGYSVIEHCYFGNQCFLSGTSSAKYFVWDAIRAIDYLCSRKEVDPDRIGVTGFSGGGTITTYVSAIDDRVLVSVPSSWSTASRRQLESKGAQDAEAELYHALKEGITLEDLLEVRAPKPTLLTFVSRDQYLTLQAARDCFEEVQLAYSSLGQTENFELVEDDSRHWLTPKIRRHIYDFFCKHFNLPQQTE